MTDINYFDTDCLSAFLWVRGESLLSQLYPGKVVLPMQVYDEIKMVPYLFNRVESMKDNGALRVESIMSGTDEHKDYTNMTSSPVDGQKIIGRGEAAAIALAKKNQGVLASNNLRDVKSYVDKYSISHITTGDILIEALNKGLITETEGNTLWSEMIRKKRMLPTATFTDYCPYSGVKTLALRRNL